MRFKIAHKLISLGIAIILLGTLLFGALACGKDTKTSNLADPFSVDMSYFSLQGYARGYIPGHTYEFKLMINNLDKEAWQGNYYAFLIDTRGIVLTIAQRNIDLSPETSLGANINMTLPGDFKEGAYGLAFVFPGRGVSITTIRVGDDLSQPAGPWPDHNIFPQS